MRLNSGIDLPIFILTDDELKLKKLDIEEDEDAFNGTGLTENRRFYLIDMVWPHRTVKDCTYILVTGDLYIVKANHKDVVRVIETHAKQHV